MANTIRNRNQQFAENVDRRGAGDIKHKRESVKDSNMAMWLVILLLFCVCGGTMLQFLGFFTGQVYGEEGGLN